VSVLGEPALADGEVRNDPLDEPPEVLAMMGLDEVDELVDDYVLDFAGRRQMVRQWKLRLAAGPQEPQR
jgi:hypothetical protein